MATLLTIEVIATSDTYRFMGVEVEEPTVSRGIRVADLLPPRRMIVATVDPATGRATGSPTWTMHIPALSLDSMRWNSRVIRSLFDSWADSLEPLRLGGCEFFNLERAPLRRETEGAYADLRFTAPYGWWSGTPTIYEDDVATPSGWTDDQQAGWITYASDPGAGVIVSATVGREPEGVITEIKAIPVKMRSPQTYDLTITFAEDNPV